MLLTLRVIWKDITSEVCMQDMKFLSLKVQKLELRLKFYTHRVMER